MLTRCVAVSRCDARCCVGVRASNNRFDPGGQEVGAASPPWGVVDMFMAWSEVQVRTRPRAVGVHGTTP